MRAGHRGLTRASCAVNVTIWIGVMCVKDHVPGSHRITLDTREQLQALVEGDWAILDMAEERADTRKLVEEWGEYYMERPIRSLRLLDS